MQDRDGIGIAGAKRSQQMSTAIKRQHTERSSLIYISVLVKSHPENTRKEVRILYGAECVLQRAVLIVYVYRSGATSHKHIADVKTGISNATSGKNENS